MSMYTRKKCGYGAWPQQQTSSPFCEQNPVQCYADMDDREYYMRNPPPHSFLYGPSTMQKNYAFGGSPRSASQGYDEAYAYGSNDYSSRIDANGSVKDWKDGYDAATEPFYSYGNSRYRYGRRSATCDYAEPAIPYLRNTRFYSESSPYPYESDMSVSYNSTPYMSPGLWFGRGRAFAEDYSACETAEDPRALDPSQTLIQSDWASGGEMKLGEERNGRYAEAGKSRNGLMSSQGSAGSKSKEGEGKKWPKKEIRSVEEIDSSVNPRVFSGKKNRQNIDYSKCIIDVDRLKRGEDKRLTVMLRNIPNSFSQETVLQVLNTCVRNEFDFFYLPVDFKTNCNLGFCYVSMLSVDSVYKLYCCLNRKKWPKTPSSKVCEIVYARIQGQNDMKKYCKNWAIMELPEQYRPIFFKQCIEMQGEKEVKVMKRITIEDLRK